MKSERNIDGLEIDGETLHVAGHIGNHGHYVMVIKFQLRIQTFIKRPLLRVKIWNMPRTSYRGVGCNTQVFFALNVDFIIHKIREGANTYEAQAGTGQRTYYIVKAL